MSGSASPSTDCLSNIHVHITVFESRSSVHLSIGNEPARPDSGIRPYMFQTFHHVPGLCRIALASCVAGPLEGKEKKNLRSVLYYQECDLTCVSALLV